MDIKNRENIEWLNYWIENANCHKRRVLLIGDSFTRGLRKKLNMFMNDIYAVDLIAMSYSILDKMLFIELEHFFEVTDYKYDYIIFQLGGHHGCLVKCVDSLENEEMYADKIGNIFQYLKKQVPRVIAVSVTKENMNHKRGEVFNSEIDKRNEIVKRTAQSLGIEYYNLNDKLDYKRIEYSDGIHFTEESYEDTARIIIADLFPDLKCIPSNRIKKIDELQDWIFENSRKKNIYIYGNGKRKELLEKYFGANVTIKGIIVSEKYQDEKTIRLNSVEKDNSVIIVTSNDAEIWKTLQKEGYLYISLGSSIYDQMDKE